MIGTDDSKLYFESSVPPFMTHIRSILVPCVRDCSETAASAAGTAAGTTGTAAGTGTTGAGRGGVAVGDGSLAAPLIIVHAHGDGRGLPDDGRLGFLGFTE